MNVRFFREVFSLRVGVAVGTAAVVFLATMAGSPSVAQDKPAQETEQTPAQAEKELAKERQLKETPMAAGRNKTALVAEAEAATRPAEEQKPGMDLSEVDCSACHECDNPTKESPCLRMCPRSVAQTIAAASNEHLPPDVVLLNAFPWEQRDFMPVPFPHKVHSDMAGIAGGCQVCHHHTTPGHIHPACRTCHRAVYAKAPGEEMRMPSLKGAYHRQCLGCHRDWSHHTQCIVCHPLKSPDSLPTQTEDLHAGVPGHPPIPNPSVIVHETGYEPGPHVTFRHEDHFKRYGYECARCHKGQSCSRCHEKPEVPGQPVTTHPMSREEQHGACFPCHEDDKCERCHSKEATSTPSYFDHTMAGFELGKYHSKLTCRACHKRLFFIRKLQPECNFCHADWSPDNFDHSVTGQVLDENHAGTDCEECHIDRKFDAPPSCTECHEEDEGISFPAKRPGPLAGAQPAEAKSEEAASGAP
jgi:hypothetical protein